MYRRKKISLISKSIMQQMRSRDEVMPIRCIAINNRPKTLKVKSRIKNNHSLGCNNIVSVVHPISKYTQQNMGLKNISLVAYNRLMAVVSPLSLM